MGGIVEELIKEKIKGKEGLTKKEEEAIKFIAGKVIKGEVEERGGVEELLRKIRSNRDYYRARTQRELNFKILRKVGL